MKLLVRKITAFLLVLMMICSVSGTSVFAESVSSFSDVTRRGGSDSDSLRFVERMR